MVRLGLLYIWFSCALSRNGSDANKVIVGRAEAKYVIAGADDVLLDFFIFTDDSSCGNYGNVTPWCNKRNADPLTTLPIYKDYMCSCQCKQNFITFLLDERRCVNESYLMSRFGSGTFIPSPAIDLTRISHLDTEVKCSNCEVAKVEYHQASGMWKTIESENIWGIDNHGKLTWKKSTVDEVNGKIIRIQICKKSGQECVYHQTLFCKSKGNSSLTITDVTPTSATTSAVINSTVIPTPRESIGMGSTVTSTSTASIVMSSILATVTPSSTAGAVFSSTVTPAPTISAVISSTVTPSSTAGIIVVSSTMTPNPTTSAVISSTVTPSSTAGIVVSSTVTPTPSTSAVISSTVAFSPIHTSSKMTTVPATYTSQPSKGNRNNNRSRDEAGSPTGAIVGAVIACIVAIVIVVIFIIWKRRKQTSRKPTKVAMDSTGNPTYLQNQGEIIAIPDRHVNDGNIKGNEEYDYAAVDGGPKDYRKTSKPIYQSLIKDNIQDSVYAPLSKEAPNSTPVEYSYNHLQHPQYNPPRSKSDPLYNTLEPPNSGEYLEPGTQISDNPTGVSEPLYNVLEGPDANPAPQDNDPVYNVLEDPNANQYPQDNDPVYNILEDPDDDYDNTPVDDDQNLPASGQDNVAYSSTIDLNLPQSPSSPDYDVLEGPDGGLSDSTYQPLGIRLQDDVYQPLDRTSQPIYQSLEPSDSTA